MQLRGGKTLYSYKTNKYQHFVSLFYLLPLALLIALTFKPAASQSSMCVRVPLKAFV